MNRGQMIRDRFHGGPPPGARELIDIWNNDLVDNMISQVWQAYDQLNDDFLSTIPWDERFDDIERSITREFELIIQDQLNKYLPYRIQHAPPEYESRADPPAMPPTYDIAFVWRSDSRIMWPLEAKIIINDRPTTENLGSYVEAVRDRFLSCYYAPFSNSGAMLSYVKSGNPLILINSIQSMLGGELVGYARFSDRHHRISDHIRQVPPKKDYPRQFRCHHLILPLRRSSSL